MSAASDSQQEKVTRKKLETRETNEICQPTSDLCDFLLANLMNSSSSFLVLVVVVLLGVVIVALLAVSLAPIRTEKLSFKQTRRKVKSQLVVGARGESEKANKHGCSFVSCPLWFRRACRLKNTYDYDDHHHQNS